MQNGAKIINVHTASTDLFIQYIVLILVNITDIGFGYLFNCLFFTYFIN